MIKNNLCGIDYSMTCPAMTVYDVKTKKYSYFFYTASKNVCGNKGHSIIGTHAKEWDSQEQRFDDISQWAFTICKLLKVSDVGLESISFGSKGKIADIGENAGVLKNKLYKLGINTVPFAPTSVKKLARNSFPEDTRKVDGKLIKMDKDKMVEAFFRDTGIALWDVFGKSKKSSPLHDIADSYFIVKMLQLEL